MIKSPIQTDMKKEKKIGKIRRLIADYMQSAGCSCCELGDKHARVEKQLAELLGVPKWEDGYGYNFNKFATKPRKL